MKNYKLKQAIASFKKLNRKFRKDYDSSIMNELIKLDKYIADNNIKWVKTYGK